MDVELAKMFCDAVINRFGDREFFEGELTALEKRAVMRMPELFTIVRHAGVDCVGGRLSPYWSAKAR